MIRFSTQVWSLHQTRGGSNEPATPRADTPWHTRPGGHRKVWAMCRHHGLPVSQASVLRLLRDDRLLLNASFQRERRELPARRKAAFAVEPTGANQVWRLDFTEFETSSGSTWRLAGCRDHWSRYELGWHVSPTANQHDAIAAIELAMAEAARLAGVPQLVGVAARDGEGNMVPLVTDNGGPFRSFRFEAFIAIHPDSGTHRQWAK